MDVTDEQRNEQKRLVEPMPEKLIGDKTYDSDPLDAALAQVGVEMISPHDPPRRRCSTWNIGPLPSGCSTWNIRGRPVRSREHSRPGSG
jgi:hypothetical protein